MTTSNPDILLHGSYQIKGTVGPFVFQSGVELQRRSFIHYGTDGETEVLGARSGRTITCDVLLHDDYSRDELVKWLDKLERLVGVNATVKTVERILPNDEQTQIDDRDAHVLKNCTLINVEQIPFGAQPHADVLPDIAGTLGTAGKWTTLVRFTWRQLATDRV